MGYRIRMAPEVAGWLGQLRDADPGTADLVDEALAALRDQGASVRSEEERLTVATRRLQHKVDDFPDPQGRGQGRRGGGGGGRPGRRGRGGHRRRDRSR